MRWCYRVVDTVVLLGYLHAMVLPLRQDAMQSARRCYWAIVALMLWVYERAVRISLLQDLVSLQPLGLLGNVGQCYLGRWDIRNAEHLVSDPGWE